MSVEKDKNEAKIYSLLSFPFFLRIILNTLVVMGAVRLEGETHLMSQVENYYFGVDQVQSVQIGDSASIHKIIMADRP